MPELPDISAYLCALEPRIVGQRLERVRVASPFILRTADPPVAAAEGHVVRALRRLGKRIAIGLDNDVWLVLHLMIAGRLHWRPAGAKLGGRQSWRRSTSPTARSCSPKPGRSGARRCTSSQARRGCAQLDPGGIDVMSCDLAAFGAALTAENHTLKRALTDPHVFSGIGNAYSDEISARGAALTDRHDAEADARRTAAAVRRHAPHAAGLDRPLVRRGAGRLPREGDGLSQGDGRARTLR